MFVAHELEGPDELTAQPKIQIQVNCRLSKYRGQLPFFTLHGFYHKVRSTELRHPILVRLDLLRRYYSAAEKLNSVKVSKIKYANHYRRPGKYHEKRDELMLFTKNFRADKVKMYKLSIHWTGTFEVLKQNHQNQNVTLDFSNFTDLSNISNQFHASLLKTFTPHDDIYF